jgi:hypothetical protein
MQICCAALTARLILTLVYRGKRAHGEPGSPETAISARAYASLKRQPYGVFRIFERRCARIGDTARSRLQISRCRSLWPETVMLRALKAAGKPQWLSTKGAGNAARIAIRARRPRA